MRGRATFGRGGSAGVIKGERAGAVPIEQELAPSKKGGARLLGGMLFWGVIGVLAFYTFGSLLTIFEDPEVRANRFAQEMAAEQELAAAKEARRLAAEEAAELAAKPPLKLHSWTCVTEYGFTTIAGEVSNRSALPIDSLMVVGVLRTNGGDFVKSSAAMVEYQPLLSGQRSPFRVMLTHNPAGKRCHVAFKTMLGGQVRYER